MPSKSTHIAIHVSIKQRQKRGFPHIMQKALAYRRYR
nr:MAG TPA: hypothetical protein [Caudoviricetes sp.]